LNKAIEILHSYIRKTIFYNIERHGQLWEKEDPSVRDDLDDAPGQQLWKRWRNDIVEDRALLEGASPFPAAYFVVNFKRVFSAG